VRTIQFVCAYQKIVSCNYQCYSGTQLCARHRNTGQFAVAQAGLEAIFYDLDGLPCPLYISVDTTEERSDVSSLGSGRELRVGNLIVNRSQLIGQLD
jgi:hypothetical protein